MVLYRDYNGEIVSTSSTLLGLFVFSQFQPYSGLDCRQVCMLQSSTRGCFVFCGEDVYCEIPGKKSGFAIKNPEQVLLDLLLIFLCGKLFVCRKSGIQGFTSFQLLSCGGGRGVRLHQGLRVQ